MVILPKERCSRSKIFQCYNKDIVSISEQVEEISLWENKTKPNKNKQKKTPTLTKAPKKQK